MKVPSGKEISVAVVGARGYSGVELCRLLLKHPHAELTACVTTDGEFQLSDYLPGSHLDRIPSITVADLLADAGRFDLVFLATPADASMELTPQILNQNAHVIDLSGAFRLKSGTWSDRRERYRSWYGLEHTCPELLDRAEFGLVPWSKGAVRPSSVATSRLIANPGCYATSVLMALLPLLKSELIKADSVVIDSKSGTSGAGRKASESLMFSEVEGECTPYRVGHHQHSPEIADGVSEFVGIPFDPVFTTHLLPVRRGIISSIYARTTSTITPPDVDQVFQEFYADYPLVRFGHYAPPKGKLAPNWMTLRSVVGSARCHIGYEVIGQQLYVFSVIDNLLKGAASQAIENLNRIFGWGIETGLMEQEGIL